MEQHLPQIKSKAVQELQFATRINPLPCLRHIGDLSAEQETNILLIF